MPRVRIGATSALLPALMAVVSCGEPSDNPFSTDAGTGAATGGSASGGASVGGTSNRGGGGSTTGGVIGKSSGGSSSTGGNASGGKGGADSSTGGIGTSGEGGSDASGGNPGSGGTATTGGLDGSGGTSGSAGASGGAPACSDTDTDNPPRTRGTTTGLNGTFTDSCDENGDLVEYACQMVAAPLDQCPLQTPGASADRAAVPFPFCPPIPTGQVTSSVFACGGRCLEGTCLYWCPDFGDQFEYVEIDADRLLLENQQNGHRYDCVVSFEAGGFDCGDPDLQGQQAPVVSLGNCNPTTVVFGSGAPGSDGPQECTYTCSLAE